MVMCHDATISQYCTLCYSIYYSDSIYLGTFSCNFFLKYPLICTDINVVYIALLMKKVMLKILLNIVCSHSSPIVQDRYQSVKLSDPNVSKDSRNNKRPPLKGDDTPVILSKVIILIIPPDINKSGT